MPLELELNDGWWEVLYVEAKGDLHTVWSPDHAEPGFHDVPASRLRTGWRWDAGSRGWAVRDAGAGAKAALQAAVEAAAPAQAEAEAATAAAEAAPKKAAPKKKGSKKRGSKGS